MFTAQQLHSQYGQLQVTVGDNGVHSRHLSMSRWLSCVMRASYIVAS